MFDYYVPDPPVPCSKCGEPLGGWQGKNVPYRDCFVWKQGIAAPIDQTVDEKWKVAPEKLATLRLADGEIEIYGGTCACGGDIWGPLTGCVKNGIWETLDLPKIDDE